MLVASDGDLAWLENRWRRIDRARELVGSGALPVSVAAMGEGQNEVAAVIARHRALCCPIRYQAEILKAGFGSRRLAAAAAQICSTSMASAARRLVSRISASMLQVISLCTGSSPEKLPLMAAVSRGLEEVARVM